MQCTYFRIVKFVLEGPVPNTIVSSGIVPEIVNNSIRTSEKEVEMRLPFF